MKYSLSLLTKFTSWFTNLTQSEKKLFILSGSGIVLFCIFQLFTFLYDLLQENERLLLAKKSQIEEVNRLLVKYNLLKTKRDTLQESFAKSQMTFEQVVKQLDKILLENIEKNKYDVTTRQPNPFGVQYERQDFTVNIKSITLEQLVKLLYALEQGEQPLFLSKVDISKNSSGQELRALLEVFSIRKNTTRPLAT